MAHFAINMDEIKEAPLLEDGDYNIIFQKVPEVRPNKNPDAQGNPGWHIYAELCPEGQPQYKIFHRWAMSPGAIAMPMATASIRRFYKTVGLTYDASGIETADMYGVKFKAKVKRGSWNGRPQYTLEEVYGPA